MQRAVCHAEAQRGDSSAEGLAQDLKPDNLLVTSSGVLKVTDFGHAVLFGDPLRQYTSQVFATCEPFRAPLRPLQLWLIGFA